MVSRNEIEKILAEDSTADGISPAKTFREILRVVTFHENTVDLDTVLQAVEPLVAIAESFDHKHVDAWPRWATTIRKVRNILKDSVSRSALTSPEYQKDNKQSGSRHGKIGVRTSISCFITEINKEAPSGLLPAKAILLIGRYGRYVEQDVCFAEQFTHYSYDDEQDLADTIRKCCTLKWKHLALAHEYLPEWPSSSPAEWENKFLETARNAPFYRYKAYPEKHDFIHTIRKILNYVSEEQVNSSPQQQNTPPSSPISPQLPPQKRGSTVVIQPTPERYSKTGQRLPVRPSFNVFKKQLPHTDANTDGLAPDSLHVVPQQDTPANQPAQLAGVQLLEVRYTNYRTAMDNQRLPWAWDSLNRFEIAALRNILRAHADLENAPLSEKQGAFLIWMLLATGQSIDRILQLDLAHSTESHGALLFGTTYRRYIYPPPHAFRPNEQQKILLSGHADFIDLPLLPPFPSLVIELGLNDSKIKSINPHRSIGGYLNLDGLAAEKVVRQFLENHRTRDIRLLPGRIRNVLGTEIMRITSDPVVAHILTSLPTDMPPSGIYYTSYSEGALQRIYKEALMRILRDKP